METVINIGDKIDLCLANRKTLKNQPEDDNRKIYKSKVYDIVDETLIKVAMPLQEGKLVLLPLDSVYDIFFYTSVGLYECEGRVVERYKENNLFVMVLELLSSLKKNQRREYYRLSCTIEAKFLCITDEELKIGGLEQIVNARIEKKKAEIGDSREFTIFEELTMVSWNEGYIVDISGGGIRFTSELEVEENSYIYVKFDLLVEGQVKQYTILTQVISCENLINRSKQFEVRAKFIAPGRDNTEEIIRYIFEEERKSRKNRKS